MYILTKVIPQKLVIVSGYDFDKVENVMKFECIKSIPEIHIVLDFCKLETEQFYYLISIPNLTKFHLLNMDISCIKPRSRDDYLALRNHGKLTEIACLVFDGVNDWSVIEFPQGLTSLALWNDEETIDLDTLGIPKSVQRLDISGVNGSFEELQHKLPPHLNLLRLISDSLTAIKVDELPIELRRLDLWSQRKIGSISGKEWPPNLTEIKLTSNNLGDNGLKIIKTMEWPERLTSLYINDNQISCIDYLELLPSSLRTLDISGNPFLWQDEQVFELPYNLKTLYMSRCCFKHLQYIKFPSSLEQLWLQENEITDILSYSDWNTLTNLSRLKVSFNSISSLDNWVIPSNVIELHLGGNPIENLSPKFPLFDPNYSYHAVELDLACCNLTTLGIDYIPPSLKRLDLRNNRFKAEFIFPSAFKRLKYLNLSGNELTSIVFDENDHNESCLFNLVLSHNLILGDEPGNVRINEFYDDLEKNLGKVDERYNNVNCIHEFVR